MGRDDREVHERLRQRLQQLQGDPSITPNLVMADRLGVSTSGYGNYVRGFGDPTLSTLVRMAERAGVTVAWLIGESEEGGPAAADGPGAQPSPPRDLSAAEAAAREASRAARRRRTQGGRQ